MVPKFRGWHKDLEQMIYGKEICGHIEYTTNLIDALNTMLNEDDYDIEVMQSTGLKGYMDENYQDYQEKDVYKGDIIDIFWEEWPMGYYQENHMVGVVDLDESGTAWIIKNAKYYFDTPKPIPSEIDGFSVSMSLPDEEDLEEIFLHRFNLSADDITILGNIFENPELLEKQVQGK